MKRFKETPLVFSWILLVGLGCLNLSLANSQGPSFTSFLTKDLIRQTPAISFSKNDQIYLYTVWSGLEGEHELKVLWIRPDKTIQETSRFNVKIPPKTPSYATWAWLSFRKFFVNILMDWKYIGDWKALLFLDDKFMGEYGFSVH